MPKLNQPTFLFIDLENVPGTDVALLKNRAVKVTVLIGKKQPKVAKRFLESLAEADFEVRLLRVNVVGPNALDFALAYHLGECAARHPQGHFYIISGDTDFDSLVAHLASHHVAVSRHGSVAELPFLKKKTASPSPKAENSTSANEATPPTKAQSKPKAGAKKAAAPIKEIPAVTVAPSPSPRNEHAERVLAQLKNPDSKNRPTKKKALLAKLQNDIKAHPELTVDQMIRWAEDDGILKILSNGKVEYLDGTARTDR